MNTRLRAVPAIEAQVPFTIRVAADVAAQAPDETGFPPEPWTRSHLTWLAAVQVLAGAVLTGAWFGASDELVFTRQIPHLDLAVVGTMVAGVVNVLWIAQGRSAVRRRKAAFLRRVALVLPATVPGGETSEPSADAMPTTAVVSAVRMTRYHRPDCPLVDGKEVQPLTAPEAADRRPCGLCRPTTAPAAGEG